MNPGASWSELERLEQAGAGVGLRSWKSVRPASQAPRPGEGSATMLDLQLAHAVLERLQNGDQRQTISETLRPLHADRCGNTHRSEISLDKFWNPAWPGGCRGLIEFRAIESRPHHQWSSAVALLWQALAAHLLDPERRPAELRFWGEEPHDRAMLPSQLSTDLMAVLDGLAGAGPVAHPTAAALHGGPALARQSGPVQHQWCG